MPSDTQHSAPAAPAAPKGPKATPKLRPIVQYSCILRLLTLSRLSRLLRMGYGAGVLAYRIRMAAAVGLSTSTWCVKDTQQGP
eukprot:366409-Chlamydomonas_euryale.AAC.2